VAETPTVAASGTLTAVIGTESDLFDTSGPGTFTFDVDPVNMAAGDLVELRVYKMVLTGGTRRVAYLARYWDVQPTDDMIKISVPVSTPLSDSGALRFTLKQVQGTGRNFPWSVNQY